MWIESYKAGGKRYYRACSQGQNPIHLGTAESIVRKLKPNVLRSEAKSPVDPLDSEGVVDVVPHESSV